jgi:DNA-directed RNA polymerase subunit RPC12/RpoP
MRVRKEYHLTCIDCNHEFTAYSPKGMRCPECKTEHLRRRKAAHQAKYRSLNYAGSKAQKKVVSMTITEVILATLEYNKEHKTHISEGEYVSLMERGLLE